MGNPGQDHVQRLEDQRHSSAFKTWRVHALAFAAVVLILAAVNYMTGKVWWVQWVFLGWGIGVVLHGAAVWYKRNRRVAAWEKSRISRAA